MRSIEFRSGPDIGNVTRDYSHYLAMEDKPLIKSIYVSERGAPPMMSSIYSPGWSPPIPEPQIAWSVIGQEMQMILPNEPLLRFCQVDVLLDEVMLRLAPVEMDHMLEELTTRAQRESLSQGFPMPPWARHKSGERQNLYNAITLKWEWWSLQW